VGSGCLDQQRTVIALAEPIEREVIGREVVNPGREIREVLGDQVEIDVILRTGV
jgi:hypothetical protein